jgi:hypothetical protein
VDLRAPLRDPELGDDGLRQAILDGIARKPKGHDFVIERARRAPGRGPPHERDRRLTCRCCATWPSG